MLQTVRVIGLLILIASVTQAEEIIPQAKPVANWVKAANDNDVDLLKSVFSARMVKMLELRGWDEVLVLYRKEFPKQFGSMELKDFEFGYFGKDATGEVEVAVKKKKLGRIRVVLENGEWKVNEN